MNQPSLQGFKLTVIAAAIFGGYHRATAQAA